MDIGRVADFTSRLMFTNFGQKLMGEHLSLCREDLRDSQLEMRKILASLSVSEMVKLSAKVSFYQGQTGNPIKDLDRLANLTERLTSFSRGDTLYDDRELTYGTVIQLLLIMISGH